MVVNIIVIFTLPTLRKDKGSFYLVFDFMEHDLMVGPRVTVVIFNTFFLIFKCIFFVIIFHIVILTTSSAQGLLDSGLVKFTEGLNASIMRQIMEVGTLLIIVLILLIVVLILIIIIIVIIIHVIIIIVTILLVMLIIHFNARLWRSVS